MHLTPDRDTNLRLVSRYLHKTSASEWISDIHIAFPNEPQAETHDYDLPVKKLRQLGHLPYN